jgi:5-methylcytosine-specific restriction endonuclease McrA
MRRRKFTRIERLIVEQRADGQCEFCRSPFDFSTETFEIEHIVPLVQGGTNEMENLALSCGGCNSRKRGYITGIDDLTNQEVPLFNPRVEKWTEHFSWSNDFIRVEGKTAIARATINRLQLNRAGVVNLRKALVRYGVFPPVDK